MEKISHQSNNKTLNLGKRRKFLYVLLFILSLTILIFEFSFNLKKELLMLRLVLSLDFLLIFIYFLLVIQKIIINRYHLIDFIRAEKADIAYLILSCLSLQMPRITASLIIVRLFVSMLMMGLKTKLGTRLISAVNLRPSQTLALSFIGLIAVGTILLTFPAATTDGQGATLLNAIFTMTSAACVTGLTIYDIGKDFTRFGQGVILVAIQVGGLGIMVLSASFAVLVGGSIPSRRQVGLREVLDVSSPEGLQMLIRSIAASTIVLEFLGAVSLFILWSNDFSNFSERLWWALFHSISAFCNAGFGLSTYSLIPFVNDPLVCLVIMFLITAGGIGFFVISDLTNPEIWKIKKVRAIWGRMQIQTRVALFATLFLNCLGMVLFLFFEYNGALRGLSLDSKIMAALFQAVSLRTAGFSTVPLANIAAPTIIFCVAYMFIGAAPGSTGGGIKTTTAAVSLMAIRAMLRGREDVEIMGRTIPPSIVSRSLSIVLIATIIILIFLTMLLATQELEFEKILFETMSAFGTVGLSMDMTASLNSIGKILIIFVMYVGRIGPLTLALAVGERKVSEGYHLPVGRIAVG